MIDLVGMCTECVDRFSQVIKLQVGRSQWNHILF